MTITDKKTILGVPVELAGDCDLEWIDDSFSHEFGTEVRGHWEVSDIFEAWVDAEQLRADVVSFLRSFGHTYNRRFKKRVRQLERSIARAVSQADPNDMFSDDSKDRAAENYEP